MFALPEHFIQEKVFQESAKAAIDW